jgi:hypothetical protein
MIKGSVLAGFILFFITINQKAVACKCGFISFSAESDNADLIFKGVVIDRKDSISIGKVFYTFKVDQVWKGKHLINVTIKTNYGGAACGSYFDINKEYIVYANNLQTYSCNRNAEPSSSLSDEPRLNFKYVLSYKQEILNDTSIILSEPESHYFNSIFRNITNINVRKTEDVDFADKRIAFFKDSLISKKQYFELYGDKDPKMYFEKFSDEQILESGGYYGIVCIEEKGALGRRQKEEMIRQLHQL